MGTYKSPGLDGLKVTFFKAYWATIGQDVISEVQSMFQERKIRLSFNHTFITHIQSYSIVQCDLQDYHKDHIKQFVQPFIGYYSPESGYIYT